MSFRKKYFILRILKEGRKAERAPVRKRGLWEWSAVPRSLAVLELLRF